MPVNPSASDVLAQLVSELRGDEQPRERVIEEFSGPIDSGTGSGDSEQTKPIHRRADAVIQELRRSWGPTADPHWVDNLVPGRPEREQDDEFDCLFALFRRGAVWGYVRMRAGKAETPDYVQLRLILGVIDASAANV